MTAARTSKEAQLLAIFRRLPPVGKDSILTWARAVEALIGRRERPRKAVRR